eukprot:scaffold19.g1822.t1
MAAEDASRRSDGGDQAAENGGTSSPTPASAPPPEAADLKALRRRLEERTAEVAGDAELMAKSLHEINAAATALQKRGDAVGAAATYAALFAKAGRLNLTHPELYICYCNSAAAHLALGLHEEVLFHAERCRQLAEASLRRSAKGSATFIKALLRKGQALLGMGRHREAVSVFEEGLKYDPFNPDHKLGLQEANEGVLRDLVEGKGRETRAIEHPQSAQRISFHPCATPLHKIRTDDMLPVKLLTPFQAEKDYHIRDTYNYVTVQTDIRMPKRHLRLLEDSYLNSRFQAAIEAAVASIEEQDRDCRVLDLGAGAGLHAMTALRAGALHVTAAERWLYMALACKEVLVANQFSEEQFKVVYKRPTDLVLKDDVPICCNLLIANILDEGLLTSGLIPAVSHALASLTTSDAIILPASATVYMQAVEIRTGEVCGLDMSAANLYRWHPAYAAGVPLAQQGIVPLSEPQEVWYFDLGSPPERSATKTVDVDFTRRGRLNAVMFWFKLHLFGDVCLSTGPEAVVAGLRGLQPAVQYLAGELPVDEGQVLPLLATHNTVRMRFDIEEADYLHLIKPDAAFPHRHYSMLADEGRAAAYGRAIARAVVTRAAADGEAHVLDVGTGSGLLALLAARAGATSVVACDLHESLCDVARKAAAANGLAHRVSVVHRDVGLLQRGREVRPLGVNIVVADMFDAGLLGDSFAYLLELARKQVVQPGATVVPAAATVYCCGVELLTGHVAGFNFSEMNKHRWEADYEAVNLNDLPHRRLTRPAKVCEFFFDGENRPPRGRDSLLKLEASVVIAPGVLNAVAFWFDLHLDDVETLTNAPDGIGEGGQVLSEAGSSNTGSRAGDDITDAAAAAAEAAGSSIAPAAAGAEVPQLPSNTAAGVPRAPLTSGEEKANRSAAALAPQAPAASACEGSTVAFQPAEAFQGERSGYVFKLGEAGFGYYLDAGSPPASTAPAAVLAAEQCGSAVAAGEQAAEPNCGTSGPAQQPQEEQQQLVEAAGSQGPPHPGPRHYWGQALQYLDRAVHVEPGRKLTLLAKRDGSKLRFSLRQGVGEWVERAPWRIEWGGGSSVENPHFQRVHYCELLVRDFLMRCKSKRFPSIEKDMAMVLAHAGSLFLDPAALQEVYHQLVVLERIHTIPEFSPGASLEALTRQSLRMH